jgi:hypothetical protein
MMMMMAEMGLSSTNTGYGWISPPRQDKLPAYGSATSGVGTGKEFIGTGKGLEGPPPFGGVDATAYKNGVSSPSTPPTAALESMLNTGVFKPRQGSGSVFSGMVEGNGCTHCASQKFANTGMKEMTAEEAQSLNYTHGGNFVASAGAPPRDG